MTRREGFKPFDVTAYLGAPQDRAAYLRAMWEDTEGDPAMIEWRSATLRAPSACRRSPERPA